MNRATYREIIAAAAADRRDVFLTAAQRLGTPLGNVEKDFWVCWTIGELYHDLPAGSPRLLFKGGTSLSKGFGLIQRFSEDIDLTVFRDDLGQSASVATLERLSGRRRRAKLDAIRDACRAYITGPLRDELSARIADATNGAGRVDVDAGDPDDQTLLLWYPTAEEPGDAYVRPVVRLECGAKSALDPHGEASIRPYIADDLPGQDFAIEGVTTIEPVRTLWDKVVIAHGLRRWFERRGTLRYDGQRVSRHYYDLHCLMLSDVGRLALADRALGADCVRHARHFLSCISGNEVITGLRYFRRQIGRPLLIIWDQLAAHRSRRVRDFLARHRADYRVEWLPGYAPGPHPEEQCNNCVKLALLNAVPNDVDDLRELASQHFKRLARKPHLLYHFFQHAGLGVT